MFLLFIVFLMQSNPLEPKYSLKEVKEYIASAEDCATKGKDIVEEAMKDPHTADIIAALCVPTVDQQAKD
jgi:hypothetical protein